MHSRSLVEGAWELNSWESICHCLQHGRGVFCYGNAGEKRTVSECWSRVVARAPLRPGWSSGTAQSRSSIHCIPLHSGRHSPETSVLQLLLCYWLSGWTLQFPACFLFLVCIIVPLCFCHRWRQTPLDYSEVFPLIALLFCIHNQSTKYQLHYIPLCSNS